MRKQPTADRGSRQREIDFDFASVQGKIERANFPGRCVALKSLLKQISFANRLGPRVLRETLAMQMGVSVRTVSRAISKAEELGVLVVKRVHCWGGGQQANAYAIDVDALDRFCDVVTRRKTVPTEGQIVPAEGQTVPAEGQTVPAEGQTVPHIIELPDEGKPDLEQPTEARAPEKRADETRTVFAQELTAIVDWWNALHADRMVSHAALRSPPSEAVLRGWRRVEKNTAVRRMLADRDSLGAAIRRSDFCRGGWFRLEKLLGARNRDGELIIQKLLDGGYMQETKSRRLGRHCPTYEENADYGW